MTSPREQAIEEAAKAIYTKSGRIGWDGQLEVHKRIWLDQAREYITAYESARARIDGAKMMPREATEEMEEAADEPFHRTWKEQRELALKHHGKEGFASAPFSQAIYRAMFDEFNKAGHAPCVPALPADVVELVIAARIVAYEDQSPEALRDLDRAAEAFSERVPWENDPEERATHDKEGT